MWKYSVYYSMDVMECEGHIVIDPEKKTLVEHYVYYGYARSFQSIASVFFIDATIYTHLPSLKSVALKAMKTHDPNLKKF